MSTTAILGLQSSMPDETEDIGDYLGRSNGTDSESLPAYSVIFINTPSLDIDTTLYY